MRELERQIAAHTNRRPSARSTPTVVRRASELRELLLPASRAARRIGLVPTMGALHEGHLSLVRTARETSDVVVVTIFVNPRQFAPREDLSGYPRAEERDFRLAAEAGADIVFAPPVEEVYPPGFRTTVSVADLSETLCGSPGQRGAEHFDGVATVVAKLFNMVGPDLAFFGQKDAQQARVIEQLVLDLNFPVQIVVCPTVRERDGLAMSSRNAYLTAAERERAGAVNQALEVAQAVIEEGGGNADAVIARALRAARLRLDRPGIDLEYLEVVSAETLQPVEHLEQELLVAVAARIGKARLIDNVVARKTRGQPGKRTRMATQMEASKC